MQRGVFYIETQPVPGKEAAYHEWYNGTHLSQVLAVDGVVSARRLRPVDGEGPFVALYELEAEDLTAVTAAMQAASERGDIATSDTLQRDPALTVRLFEVIESRDG